MIFFNNIKRIEAFSSNWSLIVANLITEFLFFHKFYNIFSKKLTVFRYCKYIYIHIYTETSKLVDLENKCLKSELRQRF